MSEAGRGARPAPPGTPRPAGDDDAHRAPHRAAQPHRQGAAGAARRHRDRVLVVRARPGRLHPRPLLRAARRPALRRLRHRLRPAHHRRLRRRLHPAEGQLPGGRGALRAVLALAALGLHHAGPQAQREALRHRVRRRLHPAVRPRGGARLRLAVRRPRAAAHPRRRGHDHRPHRAGLHRLRAVPAGGVRGQLRGAADRGRAQPRRRPELRGAQPAAGAGSSSSPSSSPPS